MTSEVEPTDDAGRTIVELATHYRAAAVVVGSHGVTFSKARRKPQTVHGSVTNYVLQNSTVPVIVCRYKEDEQPESY